MRAFIDTSSLFKRYVDEDGSDRFNMLLDSVSGIIISPVTILEIASVLKRRLQERTVKPSDAAWIEREFRKDYEFFMLVEWTDELIEKGLKIIKDHQLRVLDAIQLSAASISEAGLFVTSDKKLFKAAQKEITHIQFI